MVYLSEETIDVYDELPVKRYTWRTESGFALSAISFGAVVQKILVPDHSGHLDDVVLGFDDVQSYAERNTENFGSVIGRCANRIARGEFQIDGLTYRLAKNFWETHHLHGGNVGFDKVNYHSTVDGNKVIFSRLSKDGEEGYPGDLVVNIIYEVKDDDTWYIEYVACSTKKTVVNLTNHSYFNLAGHETGASELYNHIINLNADSMLEATHEWIPTGRILPVADTAFDLRVPTCLGERLETGANGVLYHHNFCVSTHGNQGLNFIARVLHPPSGRYMEVYSDQPGINFYTGNFMPKPGQPPILGKGGAGYSKHGGLCLETQNYIDAIHHPQFPSAVLTPGDVYRQVTKYKFGVHSK